MDIDDTCEHVSRRLLLSLGTNTGDEAVMERARHLISGAFPQARFTRIMQTQAIGMHAPDFLNCLACAETTASYEQVERWTKRMQSALGDTSELRSRGIIVMDIDILLLHGHVYHDPDWHRPYIQELFKELRS